MAPSFRTLSVGLALSLAIAPTLAQNVTCFVTGIAGDCSSFAQPFCASIGNITIGPQDNVSRCFNANGFICALTAWNNRPGVNGNQPDVINCEAALLVAANFCPLGGSGSFEGGNFVFTLDPNEGTCGDTSAV